MLLLHQFPHFFLIQGTWQPSSLKLRDNGGEDWLVLEAPPSPGIKKSHWSCLAGGNVEIYGIFNMDTVLFFCQAGNIIYLRIICAFMLFWRKWEFRNKFGEICFGYMMVDSHIPRKLEGYSLISTPNSVTIIKFEIERTHNSSCKFT